MATKKKYPKSMQALFAKVERAGRSSKPTAGTGTRAKPKVLGKKDVLPMTLDAIEQIEGMSGLQRYRHRQLLDDLRVAAARLQRGTPFADAWGPYLRDNHDKVVDLATQARQRRGEL